MLLEDDYAVRADGRRASLLEKDPQGVTSKFEWQYDELGRLVEEMFDFANNGTADPRDYIARYGFDLTGNRIALAKDAGRVNRATFEADKTETTTYDYDANDRLLTEIKNDLTPANVDRYTKYEYGLNPTANYGGDWTQLTKKTVSDGLTAGGTLRESTTYGYNLQGRMGSAAADSPAGGAVESTSSYFYNDSGTRVKQSVTTGGTTSTTLYVVDEQNPTGFSQVLEEKTGAAPTAATLPTRTFALGLDVISQTDAAAAPRFLLYDGHGSTRALVDPTGQVLSGQIYAYDAYGNMLTGSGLATPETALTTYRFNGEQTDAPTGFQYLRAALVQGRLR